jgi:hypothetical protein
MQPIKTLSSPRAPGDKMKKTTPPSSPDAYVASLGAWQKKIVSDLRSAVLSNGKLEEKIKWGHLVYFSHGPVFLIRAENQRVLFGFWRGQRLQHLESHLKPGGKYEMATMTLTEDSTVGDFDVSLLIQEGIRLNQLWGDPTKI